MTSPSVHTTHSVAGGPKARLGITLNLDGILMYSIVMYMYMSLQEWDLWCTIFTSVVSKVCLLVLNLIVPCHVCQTRGGLNSQKLFHIPKVKPCNEKYAHAHIAHRHSPSTCT